jgi:PKD repeat protein
LRFAWDFGDNTPVWEVDGCLSVTNEYTKGGWYPVTLVVSNMVDHQSVTVAHSRLLLHLAPPILYVASTNAANKAAPYESWETAASIIQEAVAEAVDGCEIFVAAGYYPLTWNIYVDKALRIHGQTGDPGDVVLRRAADNIPPLLWLHNKDAWVDGMTFHGGWINFVWNDRTGANVFIDTFGGTVSNCVLRNACLDYGDPGSAVNMSTQCALVTHCVITNNSTHSRPIWGVRDRSILYIEEGRLENCLVAGNTYTTESDNPVIADMAVMEVRSGKVRNCTFVNNKFSPRGLVYLPWGSTVENCIFAGNVERDTLDPSPICSGFAGVESCFNMCTTDGASALNNTCNTGTADSIFKEYLARDYHLKLGSPAVNQGPRNPNPATLPAVDLDGNPRLFGGRVDNGCYELQIAGGTLLIVK